MDRLGANNPAWKGDKVSYSGLHKWIAKHKPKSDVCEDCGKQGYTVAANISGEYHRDIADFKWLCTSCHLKMDNFKRKIRLTAESRWELREWCKNGHDLKVVGYYTWRNKKDYVYNVCRECRRLSEQRRRSLDRSLVLEPS